MHTAEKKRKKAKAKAAAAAAANRKGGNDYALGPKTTNKKTKKVKDYFDIQKESISAELEEMEKKKEAARDYADVGPIPAQQESIQPEFLTIHNVICHWGAISSN